MKKIIKSGTAGLFTCMLVALPMLSPGQDWNTTLNKKYLQELPHFTKSNVSQKYRMTAVYTNLDLYGNFTGKIKISGDHTTGLENGSAKWNNVSISNSNQSSGPFPEAAKQEYMEGFTYIPSDKMLDEQAFKDFPTTPESVYSKNLVWDMMAIEGFARGYTDSLKLNKNYRIPNSGGEFAMSDIGSYSHNSVQLCWTGISIVHDEPSAVIEFTALDNKLALSLPGLKTKGTEQYWGTVWISLHTGSVESAVMYGGTIQEIDVTGMPDKFLVKTIRELQVDKIL